VSLNIYKRGKRGTYWFDEVIDGVRVRQSLQTSDWKAAQHAAKQLVSEAIVNQKASVRPDFAKLPFDSAADEYLHARALELQPSTATKEKQLLTFPRAYFGTKRLQQITLEDAIGYRIWRAESAVGNTIINMEVGVLRRMLKRAKRWHLFEDDICPLKETHKPGRAMTVDEKSELLKRAAARPEWQLAYCAARLALTTTMRGCELKHLRWTDVDWKNELVFVQKSKTDAGERVIPLVPDAIAALEELRERASSLSTPIPTHYIFAACQHGHHDPTRPMSSWRTAWRNLIDAIACPKCDLLQRPASVCRNSDCRADTKNVVSPLSGLRFHDLRHHAVTELAESGEASEQTIMALAGHVSPRMLRHYSHVRQEAKRKAIQVLSARTAEKK
jgi:integrase